MSDRTDFPLFQSVPPALVFDLDGTLIDSVGDIAGALGLLLTEFGRRRLSEAEVRGMVGDGATELVRRAFTATGPDLPAEAVKAAVVRYQDIYAEHPVSSDCLYPGVVETLTVLAEAGAVMGLCTNKPERITRTLLEALDLGRFFRAVLGADVLPERKPDPAPVLRVVEWLGVRPNQAVMVGDSRNDVLAGRAAGLKTVLVSYGYTRIPARELGADAVIDRFADLPRALESWG
ncbi:MAG: phosphoglycolate phosphatase [Rhodospirillaceae bacterium]